MFTKKKDFDYRAPEFDGEVEPATPAARDWAKRARSHGCSVKVMFSLRPIPGKGSKRLYKFTGKVEKSFTGLRYAGYVTTGKEGGARICEAHLALHRDDLRSLDMVAFKKKLRRSFDLVVTGQYDDGEEVPTAPRLKNSRAHPYVLVYIGNHSTHKEANVLWTLPPVGRKRKRKRRTRKQWVPAVVPIFPHAQSNPRDSIGIEDQIL